MHEEHPHPLLAQIPLTVSPFLSLPTATPLPYTYKSLPSTLPPSILSTNSQIPQLSPDQPLESAYVTSQTGHTATPTQILASCHALQAHLTTLRINAQTTLQTWEAQRRAADLAEKRRVAPGWLDGDVKILRPENVSGDRAEEGGQQARPEPDRKTSVGIKGLVERRDGVPDPRAGEEIDRAFGGLDIK
ncbi:hypothetical protein CC78DRAFT_529134 [Lojkania enalia]|uniref:Uncharacterized protein n=1 Tax=Lojkania enalia TaxID=147567 RepID=A0A9P4N9X4_9PLEO|nr:hypothetical protein CC78DRAFT_529134 [Didymosphaeria enalia]